MMTALAVGAAAAFAVALALMARALGEARRALGRAEARMKAYENEVRALAAQRDAVLGGPHGRDDLVRRLRDQAADA